MLRNASFGTLFPSLSALRPAAPKTIDTFDLHSGALLSPSQAAFVKEWFRNHPNEVVCRALKNKQGEISNKPYLKSNFSVLHDRKTGTYWVKYHGKKKNKLLGEAGEGSVKYAQNMETLQWHALKIRKIIPSEARFIYENFVNEYRMLKKIGRNAYHLSTSKQHYLIQDFIPGQTLLEAEDDLAPLNDIKTFHLIQQLMAAYLGLFKRNIIHRDLKPDNIMVDVESEKVSIIDFSFAITKNRIIAEKQKKFFDKDSFINRGMGSSLYIHPETLKRAASTKTITYNDKSDIYGLLISIAMLCKTEFYINEKSAHSIGKCSIHHSSPFFKKFVLNHLLGAIYRTEKEQDLPSIGRLQRFFAKVGDKLAKSNTNKIVSRR